MILGIECDDNKLLHFVIYEWMSKHDKRIVLSF